VRIRHVDGSTAPLWSSGKNNRDGDSKENASFKDLKVRAVNVAEVHK